MISPSKVELQNITMLHKWLDRQHIIFMSGSQMWMMTWFISLHDVFAAAVQLLTHVLGSFLLFFSGPFAHPQIAPPLSHLQQEGIIRVQAGRTGVNLKQTWHLTRPSRSRQSGHCHNVFPVVNAVRALRKSSPQISWWWCPDSAAPERVVLEVGGPVLQSGTYHSCTQWGV